jgi:hypothetical protein
MELWTQHECQIRKLSRARIQREWRIPEYEVNVFFDEGCVLLDGGELFELVFGHPWQSLVENKPSDYQHWFQIRNQIVLRGGTVPHFELRDGCAYLAGAIHALAGWGLDQPFEHDGIAPLDGRGLTVSTVVGSTPSELTDTFSTLPKQQLVSSVHQREWEKLQDKLKDLNS